ncbi:MAG: ABC transporter substrate-binding protein [Betaproteobacteria bacterium]|nr:MAG: ABC transporter substrate-binding protein [Betaproteobacteria bacterium]
MDRRKFVGLVALGGMLRPLAGYAQQRAKVPRIGVLAIVPLQSPGMQALVDALEQGLRDRGYIDGKTVLIEYRSAGGKFEQFPNLAGELIALNVDVIVVGTSRAARIVRQATTTIPIVAVAMGDPVEDGLAASLARPGGNVTGLTYIGAELVAKRLALLREMLPSASRVAVLLQAGESQRETNEMLAEAEIVARAMSVQLQVVGVRGTDDLDSAFSAMAQKRTDALVVSQNSGLLFAERQRIVDLAAKYRLPSIYYAREFVAAGGLISYGSSAADLFKRAAFYIDRILKGAKPGDLPIEQPTKFELVINLQTAKALRLAIPQSLLLRADEVIQQ